MALPAVQSKLSIDDVGNFIKEHYLKPLPDDPKEIEKEMAATKKVAEKIGDFGWDLLELPTLPLPGLIPLVKEAVTQEGHMTKAQEQFDLEKYVKEEDVPPEERWTGPRAPLPSGTTIYSADRRPLWTVKPPPPPAPTASLKPMPKRLEL